MDMLQMKHLSGKPMLRLHHVAHREFWKGHERLAFAIRRGRRDMVAERVYEDDEVLAGIHHVVRTDERQQILRGATQPGRPENYIGPVRVQLAQGAIAKTEIANGAAVLQLKIAKVSELLCAFGNWSLCAGPRGTRQ